MLDGYTLPETQKAVVLRGTRDAAALEIPVWDLAQFAGRAVDPDDLVLLEVEACGICGSDPRYYAGENPWAQHTLGEFRPSPPNLVLGHEYVGRVVAARGEHNRRLLGMRTAGVCWKGCGACELCLDGMEHLCPQTVHIGHAAGWGKMDFYPGAYAQYCPAWGAFCEPLPDHVASNEGTGMDILAVCVHMAKIGNIRPGSAVVILGAGPAGNGIAQVARNLGAARIALTDVADIAVKVGAANGFDVINVAGMSRAEQEAAVREAAGGVPVSAVFDTVGYEDTVGVGMKVLGPGGTMVMVAVHEGTMDFAAASVGAERSLTTSCNFQMPDFRAALSMLIEGRIGVKPWLSTCTFDEVPGILDAISQGNRGDMFKVALQPNG